MFGGEGRGDDTREDVREGECLEPQGPGGVEFQLYF